MVKLKKIQKKKYKLKERGITKYNHEITGILLLGFGVLVTSGFYFNSIGLFGKFIRSLMSGLLGIPAYLIPALIIVYAAFLIFKKDTRDFKLRMLFSLILVLLLSSMIQIGYYNPRKYENMNVISCITAFYRDGEKLNGGGVIGGMISTPFLLTFQVLGTIIILTTLSIIDAILLTNVSIVNFFRNLKKIIIKKRDAFGGNKKEPKAAPRVIDFRIEKNARESKEKTVNIQVKDKDYNEVESSIEPVELIMKDIKKNIGSEVVRIKGNSGKDKFPDDRHGGEYIFPDINLLNESDEDARNSKIYKNTAIEGAKKLEETLKSFGVEARVVNISRGPTVTRYELQPSPGVKVSKIVSLSDDISLNLASAGVRIEAPIPGKAAIGIEVPNKEITPILLREVIESPEFIKFPYKLAFAVGKDISGETIIGDIAKMPHLLISGATGSGKSVCLNNLIISLLYKASPDEVKLLMIDPKVVELGIYNGIPHLLIPVVTDPRKAASALNWAVQEMINRYKLFAEKGARDLKGYNQLFKESEERAFIPQIVIIIDELADLMLVAPNEVEDAICRLAQMARAAGMHLVIATQRPSVDVITGVIKANIPSRISFAVTSQVDSRTILDMAGAEKLLGKGDMLFYPAGKPKPIRIQGAFISEKEIERVVTFIKAQYKAEYDNEVIEEINSENRADENDPGDNDELLPQAIDLVVESGQASVSFMQRKFKVGYARAARIIDQMEARGIVGGFEGSKPRQVLMSKQKWQELQMTEDN